MTAERCFGQLPMKHVAGQSAMTWASQGGSLSLFAVFECAGGERSGFGPAGNSVSAACDVTRADTNTAGLAPHRPRHQDSTKQAPPRAAASPRLQGINDRLPKPVPCSPVNSRVPYCLQSFYSPPTTPRPHPCGSLVPICSSHNTRSNRPSLRATASPAYMNVLPAVGLSSSLPPGPSVK